MTAPIVNTPGTKPIAKIPLIAREAEAWALTQGVRITLFYGSTTWPDHKNRRCIDLMTASAVDAKTGVRLTPAQSVAFGHRLRAWLAGKDRLRRHGWLGLIWFHQVTGFPHGGMSPYRGPYGVKRKYTLANQHIDHVHGETDGADYIPPKPGPVGPIIDVVVGKLYPKPSSKKVLVVKLDPGQADSDSVYWTQVALNQVLDGDDIKATGDYDAPTVAAVKRFQELLGDDVDGDLGPLQTAELFRRAKIKVEIVDA